jgi:hypothetical protein
MKPLTIHNLMYANKKEMLFYKNKVAKVFICRRENPKALAHPSPPFV